VLHHLVYAHRHTQEPRKRHSDTQSPLVPVDAGQDGSRADGCVTVPRVLGGGEDREEGSGFEGLWGLDGKCDV
jgi:hypothetical protein